ncbi:serine dehydratase subunit alpha family protein [Phascolarctobacterium sp.]|uniref:L-cysteine desulfidase family protein n=1 Tax=Phascolarctobacterium sp. TaxID=2049039 RepID=UPI003866A3FA
MLSPAEIITFLKQDVTPALGCTEPVCIALAVAHAAAHVNGAITKVTVEVCPNLYKNGMSAGIPNYQCVGLEKAALLGAVLRNPQKNLQLLEDITPQVREQVETLLQAKAVDVTINNAEQGLYVKAVVTTVKSTATCIIRNAHTNVVYLEADGNVLIKKDATTLGSDNTFVEKLLAMTFAQIRTAVEAVPVAELSFLQAGVAMNEALAAYAEKDLGCGLAKATAKNMQTEILGSTLMAKIQHSVMAAAENRLDGCPYPTMSSSGAGTKGLVVSLPISEAAKFLHSSDAQLWRALAFAHLLNRYINAKVGKLAPICSCAAASSTAATAGLTYLLGGNDQQIAYAVRNITGTITGMICDGGKVGCALKVATSSTAALLCALTAMENASLRPSDGICAATAEECIDNVARIANPGMLATDKEILAIMLEK